MPLDNVAFAAAGVPTGWRTYDSGGWVGNSPSEASQIIVVQESAGSTTNPHRYDGETLLTALHEWSRTHNIRILPYAASDAQGYNLIFYGMWTVQASAERHIQTEGTVECECGREWQIGFVRCPECNSRLRCGRCHGSGWTMQRYDGHLYCHNCTMPCSECNTARCAPSFTACAECVPRHTCAGRNCNRSLQPGLRHTYEVTHPMRGTQYYCTSCRERLCRVCNYRPGTTQHPISGRAICQQCLASLDIDAAEAFDVTADLPVEGLVVEATQERPIRICSLELEFCGGHGNSVAAALNAKGLSNWNSVREYHHSRTNYPCYVERDSSVDGGELICNRFRLDTTEDAGYLKECLDIIREHQKQSRATITVRTGLHIHVDLHGYNLTDARHLAMIFNYLEDPLYRLAAARYTAHRIILARSRYAMSPPKGVWKDNAKFGMDFLRNSGHSHALNLQHFYNAYRTGCRCGAAEFGEDWSLCTCGYLGKCTAEWRVFNGTSNPRKIHAYVALVQSLTAWAQQRDADADAFPALVFDENTIVSNGTTTPERVLMREWKSRLEWIFRNLYFSDTERDDLLYCINNSELSTLGTDFIESLKALNEQRQPEEGRTLEVQHLAERGPRDQEPAASNAGGVQWSTPTPGYYEDEGDIYIDEEPY